MEEITDLSNEDKMKIAKSNPDAIKILQKLIYNTFENEYEQYKEKLLDNGLVGEELVSFYNLCDKSVDLVKIVLEKESNEDIMHHILEKKEYTFDELIAKLEN